MTEPHGSSPPRRRIDWRRIVTGGTLVTVDALVVLACLAVCWEVRNGPMVAMWPSLAHLYPFTTYLERLYFLLPWTLAFAEAGLYSKRVLFWDEVRQVIRACTAASLFAVFLSAAVRPEQEVSRLVIASTWVLTLLVVPVVRYKLKIMLIRAGLWRRRMLIVGAGDTGARVCESTRTSTGLGYEPVAFVDDDPAKIGRTHAGLSVRGPIASLRTLIQELDVKDIVVAMPRLPRERLVDIIGSCEGHVHSIRVIPDMLGLASVGVETQDLDGILLLNIRWNLAKPWNAALKRGFDVVVAGSILVFLAPVLLLIACAIRLDSNGPALFWQDRLGHRRRRFSCAKFRSMYLDNEERLQSYLAAHPEVRTQWRDFAKLKVEDPRVTRVGRLLRRFSLDELPQFWNVLEGHMSLVGPRPYLPREIELMGEFAETILKATPGLTGLWQVSGRNELPFEQRLRLDEYYVRNWSLWMDVMILAKTGAAVLRARGAY